MTLSPDGFTLRPGTAFDLPAVAEVMRQAFDPEYGEAWTQAQCAGILSLPGVWMTVAQTNGMIAGFTLSRAVVDEGELLLIATHPSCRRRGIGAALLRSVLEEAKKRNVTHLHLEVRAGNTAVELYRSHGFIKTGERRDYYRGMSSTTYDAYSFTREIENNLEI